ncbi:thioredoxin family protein [Alkalicoccus daliensis]|uniref:Thioredoxin n=1 Tax=Alkalicoccus daliensis TaxID=745820 RepID=A0A1H0KNQ5_9BACI|nr:thioredoxin family protein [Alkalicoccus daliensis]SDO57559.1 Thioredoxin [Alkalicoccus daliensis]
MIEFSTLDEIEQVIHSQPLVLVYISRENCSVCHALLPQVECILEDFKEVTGIFLSADKLPEAASRFEVLTAPAVLLYADGKEKWRGARFIQQMELRHQLTQWTNALK